MLPSVAESKIERKSLAPFFSTRRAHRPPRRRRLGGARVARRQQHLQLMRRQTPRHLVRIPPSRPPAKTPFGKPLLREPESLAIIDKTANRRTASATENEQPAGKRIGSELLLTQPCQ